MSRLSRIIAAGVVVLGLSGSATPGSAAPILSIQPPATTVDVGDTFTLEVYIDQVADLFAFDAELGYDPLIIEVVQLLPGTFLGTGADVDPFSDFIDNGIGEASGAQSRLTVDGVSGSGVLFSVLARALAPGFTWVDFDVTCDQNDPFCSSLRDNLDQPMDFDTESGLVTVRPRVRPVPEPGLLLLLGLGLAATHWWLRRPATR